MYSHFRFVDSSAKYSQKENAVGIDIGNRGKRPGFRVKEIRCLLCASDKEERIVIHKFVMCTRECIYSRCNGYNLPDTLRFVVRLV